MGSWMHMCCVQNQPSAELAVEGMQIEEQPLYGMSSAPALQPVHANAFRRMPKLRILVVDGVRPAASLAGFELPRLAMVSWRGGSGRRLPLEAQTMMNAVVLDINEGEFISLPSNLQARPLPLHGAGVPGLVEV